MRRLALLFLLFALPAAAQVQDETGANGAYTPDRSTTCTLGSLNAACTVVLEGRQGVGGYLALGTLSGTVTPEVLVDGSTWVAVSFLTWSAGAAPARAATISATTLFQVELPAGAKQARIRVSAYTSGSGTGTLIATAAPGTQKAQGPGGSDTQVQFNDAGAFGGDSELVWNKTSNRLTLGSGANSFYAQPTATNFSDNFLSSTGTLTRADPAGVTAMRFSFDVDASATTENSYGLIMYMYADANTSASSSNVAANFLAKAPPNSTSSNVGVITTVFGAHPGPSVALSGSANDGDLSIGSWGSAFAPKNSATNIGVLGEARNTGTTPTEIGGAFVLNNVLPASLSFASAALLADNGASTSPIFLARDNGTPVFTIANGGTTTMTAPLLLPDGAIAAPALAFASFPTLGIFQRLAGTLSVAADGANTTAAFFVSDLRLRSAVSLSWATGQPDQTGADLSLFREAANILGQRNGTNGQTFQFNGTFTDVSNYTRGALQATSTTVTLAAETAGTGADNIDVTLTPAGTGVVTANGGLTVPLQGDLCLQDSAGGDGYCFQSEATAPAGSTILTLNIDPATCSGDGNGGALTVDGSNNIICSADAGGGGSGLDHPQVMTRAAYGSF